MLFFDDEAVALAAGHRPCALCRRSDYVAFLDAWAAAFGTRPTAVELDRVLHADRLDGGVQRRHRRPWRDLPDAAFVDLDGMPAVVRGDRLVPWSAGAGYGAPRRRPLAGDADVLTPACTIEVLGAGYRCARGTRSPAPPATSAG